jgi:hypothetical protein
MEKRINKTGLSVALLITMGIAITLLTVMFPAAATFGGYQGIIYHGFPIGWMGETRNGIGAITGAYGSLQYTNYLIGFIVDVVFWFCVAFILFIITLSQRRVKG